LPEWDKVDYEIDLMSSAPESDVFDWIKAGAKRIVLHFESSKETPKLIKEIRAEYGSPRENPSAPEIGMSALNDTQISLWEDIIPLVDFVQLMGIRRIGYQGEPFDERVLERIKILKAKYPELVLSVDGAVSADTAPILIKAGVPLFKSLNMLKEQTRSKSMKKIVGKPMLELLFERVKNSKLINEIVVATTQNPNNDVIEELAKKMSIGCFRGSENDVLDRVLNAAKSVSADVILELWGDNPLIDPKMLDNLIKFYSENDFDCVGTALPNFKKTYPIGISTLIFSTKILEEVNSITNDPEDRENVSNYIYEHPEKYKISSLPCPPELDYPDLRLTVDEENDFNLVKTIFENLYSINPMFDTYDIINFIKLNPQLKNLNKNVMQKKLKKWDKFTA